MVVNVEHNRKPLISSQNRLRRSAVGFLFAVASLARVAGAETYESRHYRIESDLEPSVVRDYGLRMDAMYEEYQRRLADFSEPTGKKFSVHLFRKRSDYVKFTGNRIANSAGIFIPSQNTLAGYEELQGRYGLRQTLQHEAFHQFAWERISHNLPIWLDEGLAQVFEEGVWTGNQFILGQAPPTRIEDFREDFKAGRFIRFRDLMKMSRDDFQARMKDSKTARAQYNQAWAMTQFLIFDATPDGRPRYRTRFLAWLEDMHGNADSFASFVENFSNNIEGFEQRFLDWAMNLKPTPMSVYSYRMSKLAELVRLFKLDGREFNSADDLRQYLSQGRFQLTEKREGQTYVREENALTYLNDLADRPWGSGQLRFEKRSGPLPEIVLRPPDLTTIRVRFVKSGSDISAELLFGD